MQVEVINTGTELLLGSVLNTHLRFLAQELFPLGLRVTRQVTVPDGPDIRNALLESFARAGVVIVTGGLGPTTDDITREVTAELLGLELVHDEAIMAAITARFVRRGLTTGPRVGRQAERPREAVVLPNENGTAPGLYFAPRPRVGEDPGALTPHIFLLPGPPRELHPMFRASVLPILKSVAPASDFGIRTWRIAGLGESHVEEKVGERLLALGVELGYCARPGEVDLRVIGSPEALQAAESIVVGALEPNIVSPEARSLESVVVELLAGAGATVATAESCTGGFLAHRITNVPGASAVFLAGFVTYANEAKERDLAVDGQLIADNGAVSAQVAAAMAEGARTRASATYGVATTGIAGPGGGSAGKPVGTVYIALAKAGAVPRVEHRCFPTERETFKDLATQTALDLIRRELRGLP